ncbi:pentapeptide repeat-containing protein [Streptomyces scabiei]|uniref:pentapeptide repeat-containing protein n=1 Tax=Streptomyces scabiei TaxID=1930 RepID=UPI0029A912C4|nr:pentapeptide repeat-containing protein [Streptomyces scabiei]MDX2574451.1 pentapeptide repeat-containing protein [Streptomyces scabiei]
MLKALAIELRKHFQAGDWTVTALAERAGLQKSRVSELLRGKSTPQPETLEMLCRAMNIGATETSRVAQLGEEARAEQSAIAERHHSARHRLASPASQAETVGRRLRMLQDTVSVSVRDLAELINEAGVASSKSSVARVLDDPTRDPALAYALADSMVRLLPADQRQRARAEVGRPALDLVRFSMAPDVFRLTDRYATAVEQISNDDPVVRLQGVWNLTDLADAWGELRQTCIDALCSYLRTPYQPDPAKPGYRDGERAVRRTIIQVVREHLQDPDDPISWCTNNFAFIGANFDDADLCGSTFKGTVDFEGATFSGNVRFSEATFNGMTGFRHTTLSGTIDYNNATFNSTVDFEDATFSGTVRFSEATFNGMTGFRHTTLSGTIDYNNATFNSTVVDFENATFSGTVRFSEATFNSTAGFRHTTLSGTIDYNNATFAGAMIDFEGASFDSGIARFRGADFRGVVWFRSAKFSDGSVDFRHAVLHNGTLKIEGAAFNNTSVSEVFVGVNAPTLTSI